ncbi:unnamed protein product [Camellia sinensis]
MDVGPGEKVLTEAKIGDMKTWVSAAVPAAPDLGRSEHAAAAAQVSESTWAGVVSAAAGNTGDREVLRWVGFGGGWVGDVRRWVDPKYKQVLKKFPVVVMVAIMAGGSQGCRKRRREICVKDLKPEREMCVYVSSDGNGGVFQ